MRGYITEAIAKQRAKDMLRSFLWDTFINAAAAYFIAYRWGGAPGWGAFIIFMLLQQGDTRRRARKFGVPPV